MGTLSTVAGRSPYGARPGARAAGGATAGRSCDGRAAYLRGHAVQGTSLRLRCTAQGSRTVPTPTVPSRPGEGARYARPGTGDAPALWGRTTQGHARPPDRCASPSAHRTALDAPCWRRCGSVLYELALPRAGSPDYAVVARRSGAGQDGGARGGHGLVNAVLRRGTREGAEALLEGLSDETAEQAAVKHSHPEWIARLWWEQLGASDARALMAYDNEPGEVALRANTLVTDVHAAQRWGERPDGIPPVADTHRPRHSGGAGARRSIDAHDSRAWREGAFAAQSRAAMKVARALDPRPGEQVLDLCAAPAARARIWQR